MNEVFVVLAEFGEYSDRVVLVAGVYATEDEAKAAVEAAAIVHQAHESWLQAYHREMQKVRPLFSSPWDHEKWKAGDTAVRALLPPEPADESGEHFSIEKRQLGVWGDTP